MKFKLFALLLFVLISPKVYAQTISGIDVAQWQGTIDWVQVKSSGVDFAYARATEGLANTDFTFQNNMTSGLAAGMVMGAYCFGRPNVSATGSAQHFVSVAGSYIGQGYLPPVIDIETTEGMTYAAISAWVQDWITEVELLTGTTPMIYTGGYFGAELNQSLDVYPLWIAQWGVPSPSILGIWNDWLFWQHTATGSVAGISGNVNLDVFNGDSIAFDSLLGLGPSSIEALSTAVDFMVFPNPFKDLLNITTSVTRYYELTLTDLTGRVLYKKLHSGSITVETTSIKPGLYVYQFRDKEGQITRKTLIKN